jgi:Protein of unknown function (DUF2384)
VSLTALSYPATKFAPSKLVDINSRSERARLSPAGLKAFFKIMEHWQVRDESAKALLGGVTNGPFYEMKKSHVRVLNPDTLTRISYLIGIYKALNILYGKKLANDWISLPNGNPIFGGNSPLDYMMSGGIPAMQTVRRLLDSRRGM